MDAPVREYDSQVEKQSKRVFGLTVIRNFANSRPKNNR
ncbi:hypothetical protein CLV89_1392 [Tritonibacter scottomollicae]|uniref:Uncharacterized protein n=1 Tax=Tritonibacter scottomollicae TaxID=483013 RepID=A0A2T0ZZV2_TRISK|nr:hypothetical protein CLV89_1392 [Tritonibacter scottomollicae]